MLRVENLSIAVNDSKIIDKLNISFDAGKIYALMGPNGSGKSTLANALMGHPHYHIIDGSLFIDHENITHLTPDKRAKMGLFLALQHPPALPGVRVFTFLKEAQRVLHDQQQSVDELYDVLCDCMDLLDIDHNFAYRNLNDGFSGGEKKKFELLQLLLFNPRYAILDEIDSGLDVDALKKVADGILLAREQNPSLTLILITHYQRILEYIKPDAIYVMHKGDLVACGDYTLAHLIEKRGYDSVIKS